MTYNRINIELENQNESVHTFTAVTFGASSLLGLSREMKEFQNYAKSTKQKRVKMCLKKIRDLEKERN
jgi:uncharacterized membrane protein (DUF106 family)